MLMKNKTEENTFLPFYQDACRMWMIMPHLGFPSKPSLNYCTGTHTLEGRTRPSGTLHHPRVQRVWNAGRLCRVLHTFTQKETVYFDPDIVHSEAPLFLQSFGKQMWKQEGGRGAAWEVDRLSGSSERHCAALHLFLIIQLFLSLCVFFFLSWTNNADIILQTLAAISFRPRSKFWKKRGKD